VGARLFKRPEQERIAFTDLLAAVADLAAKRGLK
jgi:hypothetical protein